MVSEYEIKAMNKTTKKSIQFNNQSQVDALSEMRGEGGSHEKGTWRCGNQIRWLAESKQK